MQPCTREVIFWFSQPDESKIYNFVEIRWKIAPRKGLISSFFYFQQSVAPAGSCCIPCARTARRGEPSLLALG